MKKTTYILLFTLLTSIDLLGQHKVTISTKPDIVFVEQGEYKQCINFDFLISNNSTDTLSISKISVSVYDANNRLVHSRFLDGNGTAPSIQTIPNRDFSGISAELIFNPFTEFNPGMLLRKMEYEFTFLNQNQDEFVIKTIVSPQKYNQSEKFTFPLKGNILVYDGHDIYTHHRRFNYEFAPIKELGIRANFMRYAYDFVLLDSTQHPFQGSAEKPENYYGYGKSIYSITDGKVIYASNKHNDDKTFNIPEIANNALELYGNCIAIQHKNKTISIYGHLKRNSLKVEVGDHVKKNQEIASIGISGSSFFPHLHFEIRTSINHSAEGIPSYFSNVYLFETNSIHKLKSGLVETGDIIRAK